MRKLLLFPLLLLLVTSSAHAEWRFETLGGQCQYKLAGDGIWWNSGYSHGIDLTHSCTQFGFLHLKESGAYWTGWRVDYVNLGSVNFASIFPMVDGEQFTVQPDGSHCNHQTHSGCIGNSHGWQSTEGLSLGAVMEDRNYAVAFGMEGGIYAYYGKFHYSVSTPYMHHGEDTFGGWRASPYLGVSARYGYIEAQVRAYMGIKTHTPGCGDCTGITKGPVMQASIGLSVPF
jgi:hypothetical protein